MDVVDDQVGSPTYVPDLVAALLQLADSAISESVLHAANAGAGSRFDQARAAFDRAVEILSQHRSHLDCIAKALEEEETLDDVAIEKLIGPPAWKLAETAAKNGKPRE